VSFLNFNLLEEREISNQMMMMMSQKKELEGGSSSLSQPPYHVIHKLPPGNTPYVRAKHVQVTPLHSLFFLSILLILNAAFLNFILCI